MENKKNYFFEDPIRTHFILKTCIRENSYFTSSEEVRTYVSKNKVKTHHSYTQNLKTKTIRLSYLIIDNNYYHFFKIIYLDIFIQLNTI